MRSLNMKYMEGDFIQNNDGAFFDVKGFVHPPSRTVAFIRYFPSEKGDRKKMGLSYDKVYSFSERHSFLKERYPHYLVQDAVFDEMLCEVPDCEIKKRYKPVKKMMQLRIQGDLDPLEEKVVQFAENLKSRSNIPWNAIGISGSVLIDLQKTSSDLDPVIYGLENCRKTYSALQDILNENGSFFKPYRDHELERLFDFRSKDTAMSFEQFLRTESKKAYQGKFMGTDYFVRFIKDWEEVDEKYGDIQYKNVGHAKIHAVVADDSESIFTPCKYVIRDVTFVEGSRLEQIREVASFRGRFCDQARKGDSIVAQGKVERVMNKKEGGEYLRLLIGNERSDYMVVV